MKRDYGRSLGLSQDLSELCARSRSQRRSIVTKCLPLSRKSIFMHFLYKLVVYAPFEYVCITSDGNLMISVVGHCGLF